ncbi:MAG: bifunctional hydroxymethylpyrimidine kinase/phosphomethylpyrimidine kinase [Thiotrichales bacterium]|nr:bifunctional hydroxymethylpyrimidine kinase/phosphomethylpyrimidine kinase [Thiotrichales bacterium]
MSLPCVLSVAGFDPSGGAGLQADCKTIHALGAYALTVVTAVTAQNSRGVQAVYPLEDAAFGAQLAALGEDYQIGAIKIGMLSDAGKIATLARFLEQMPRVPVVLDPVLVSTSGTALLQPEALQTLITQLLPRCTLLTPNRPEMHYLAESIGCPLDQATHQSDLTHCMNKLGVKNLLLKGGHSQDADAGDWLLSTERNTETVTQSQWFRLPRLKVQHAHGTGCTLSAAIAVHLAQGQTLSQAVAHAKHFVHSALAQADQNQPLYRHITTAEAAKRRGGLHHFWKSDSLFE